MADMFHPYFTRIHTVLSIIWENSLYHWVKTVAERASVNLPYCGVYCLCAPDRLNYPIDNADNHLALAFWAQVSRKCYLVGEDSLVDNVGLGLLSQVIPCLSHQRQVACGHTPPHPVEYTHLKWKSICLARENVLLQCFFRHSM